MNQIKPQELRIGNWVKWPNEKEPNEVEWSHGHWLGVYAKHYPMPDPILLTEEWLKKFRFEHHPISWSKDISYFPNEEYKALCVTINQGLIVRCGHQTESREQDELMVLWNNDIRGPLFVHTLQNVFYTLTGTELTFLK